MTDKLISIKELSELLDLTPQRVQQLAREGVIPREGRGRYLMLASVNGYVNLLRQRAVAPTDSRVDYMEQRARLTKAQADTAEVELERKLGNLAPVEDFEKEMAAVMTAIRINMMNIPQRVVTQLLGETNETRFKEVLRSEIVLALTTSAEAELDFEDDDK